MDVLFVILLSVAVGLLIGSIFVDLIALLRLEQIVNWGQRVFFGIGRPVIGPETFIGETAVVLELSEISEDGSTYTSTVEIDNECWTIRCPEPVEAGQLVRIEKANGAILDVIVAE